MIIETIEWFVGHTSIDREEKRTLCVHWVLSSIHHVYIVCWYLNRAQLSKRGWHFSFSLSLNVNPICYLSTCVEGPHHHFTRRYRNRIMDRRKSIRRVHRNAGVLRKIKEEKSSCAIKSNCCTSLIIGFGSLPSNYVQVSILLFFFSCLVVQYLYKREREKERKSTCCCLFKGGERESQFLFFLFG